MIKRIGLSAILILIFFTSNFIDTVVAKEPNALDCIEGTADEDCLEDDEVLPVELGEEEIPATKETGSIVFDIIKMVFVLFLILILIYVLLKFINKRNKLFQQVSAIENVGGVSVGPNKSIQIIRLGTKMYMIGVGENVEMLQEVTDEDVKDDLLYKKGENNFQAGAGKLFKNLVKPKSNVEEDSEFKQSFSNELDKLKNNRKEIRNQYNQKEDNHE